MTHVGDEAKQQGPLAQVVRVIMVIRYAWHFLDSTRKGMFSSTYESKIHVYFFLPYIDRKGTSADVFYIDYGETENLQENRICSELLPEFESFPSQALRCCIAGIKPVCNDCTKLLE